MRRLAGIHALGHLPGALGRDEIISPLGRTLWGVCFSIARFLSLEGVSLEKQIAMCVTIVRLYCRYLYYDYLLY